MSSSMLPSEAAVPASFSSGKTQHSSTDGQPAKSHPLLPILPLESGGSGENQGEGLGLMLEGKSQDVVRRVASWLDL